MITHVDYACYLISYFISFIIYIYKRVIYLRRFISERDEELNSIVGQWIARGIFFLEKIYKHFFSSDLGSFEKSI